MRHWCGWCQHRCDTLLKLTHATCLIVHKVTLHGRHLLHKRHHFHMHGGTRVVRSRYVRFCC